MIMDLTHFVKLQQVNINYKAILKYKFPLEYYLLILYLSTFFVIAILLHFCLFLPIPHIPIMFSHTLFLPPS